MMSSKFIAITETFLRQNNEYFLKLEATIKKKSEAEKYAAQQRADAILYERQKHIKLRLRIYFYKRCMKCILQRI